MMGQGYFARRSRPPVDEDARVLPLINIVFLLLIFFMVTGHMIIISPTDSEPVRSDTRGTPVAGSLVLFVDSQRRFVLDGEFLSLVQIEQHLRELSGQRAQGGQGIQAGHGPLDDPGGQALRVSLQADGGLDAAYVVSVMDRLRQAGAQHLELLVLAE
jgi:biopolymer transport protein TolR